MVHWAWAGTEDRTCHGGRNCEMRQWYAIVIQLCLLLFRRVRNSSGPGKESVEVVKASVFSVDHYDRLDFTEPFLALRRMQADQNEKAYQRKSHSSHQPHSSRFAHTILAPPAICSQ